MLLGAEVTAGLVAADRGAAAAPGGARRDARVDPARSHEARDDDATASRGRSRSPAGCCRAPLRDDVYLLYLVFRTLDDLVDEGTPDAARARRGGRALVRTATAASDRARSRVLEDLASRHPLPRAALARLLRGHALGPRGRARSRTEAELDALLLPRRRDGRRRHGAVLGTTTTRGARPAAAALGMAMQRTNILRDIDEDGAAGRVYLARETHRPLRRAAVPGAREALLRDQIARADARYDEGIAGIELLRDGPVRGRARRPGCTARSCARSSARATAREAGRATVAPPPQALGGARRVAVPAR